MKCLLVSDLHYALKQYDWVDRVAPAFDVVVIAGDHLDVSSPVSLDAQVTVILAYVRRLQPKTRVIVSSGNHDLTARNADDEKVARWMTRVRQLGVASDGDRVEVDDTTITICPWWDGPCTRADVEAQLVRDAALRRARWLWVYHAPPDDSPVSWDGHRHYGDVDLLGWVRRFAPDIVLTGHIHQSPFRAGGSWVDRIGSTWVFNAGRQIGPVPTHVVLETTAPRAMWFSLAGNEVVPLDRPLARPPAPLLQETFAS